MSVQPAKTDRSPLSSEAFRRMLVTRTLILRSAVLHGLWMVMLSALQQWPIFYVTLGGCLGYLAAFVFLHNKHQKAAALSWVLTLQSMLFVGPALAGGQGGAQVMLIVAVGLPLILFDLRKERLLAIVLAFINIVLYLALDFVDFRVVHWSPEEAAFLVPIIERSSVLTTMFLVFAQVYYLTQVSGKYVHKLEAMGEDLKRESKAKDAFIAHISHELRTPLNAINGMAHVLQQERETQDHRLDAIHESGQHMLAMVNDLLDFSKLQKMNLEPQLAPVDLQHFAHQLSSQFSAIAQEKGIDWEVSHPTGAAHLDEKYILQITNNLISNALKFTSNGFVRVEIQTEQDRTATLLSIRVSNSGPGVPDELVDQIFKPFDQGGRDREIAFGGTGLGLPIAQQIAEGLGGSLELVDPSAGNTVFECRFPCVIDEAVTVAKAPVAQLNFEFPGKHVLVADDNALNCMVMQEFLTARGVEVTLAADGLQALDAVQNKAPDLVLMDLRMPGMDGFEASKALRKLGYEMPIVALSASSYREIADKLEASGMDGFQTKPFEPEALLKTLDKFLGGRSLPSSDSRAIA